MGQKAVNKLYEGKVKRTTPQVIQVAARVTARVAKKDRTIMITQSQLMELLSDIESDRVERTESTDDTDKFSQAVCAFANDMPNHRQHRNLTATLRSCLIAVRLSS